MQNTNLDLRLRILWTLYIHGHVILETAPVCNISAITAQKWKKRYNESDYDGLADLPKSGRPQLVPREAMRHIKKWCHAAPRSSLEVYERILKITGMMYSKAHTRHLMLKFNMSRKVPIRFHINAAKFEEVEI